MVIFYKIYQGSAPPDSFSERGHLKNCPFISYLKLCLYMWLLMYTSPVYGVLGKRAAKGDKLGADALAAIEHRITTGYSERAKRTKHGINGSTAGNNHIVLKSISIISIPYFLRGENCR